EARQPTSVIGRPRGRLHQGPLVSGDGCAYGPSPSYPRSFAMRLLSPMLVLVVFVLAPDARPQQASAPATPAPTQPKPATEATKAANRAIQQYLDFSNREDFENATRGLIGRPETLTIKGSKGNVVWDMESYKGYIGVDKPAPDTVNPSLWRNAQLNMQY